MMKQLIFCIVLAFCLLGCSNLAVQTQLHTASAISVGANAALPVLLEQYRATGVQIIAQSDSRESAELRLKGLKRAWEPVWSAWDGLAAAHSAWVAALQGDGGIKSALAALKSAYCGLVEVWPLDIPALPMVPVSCTAKNPKI